MSDSILDQIRKRSDWYGASARRNQTRYKALKTAQILLAAAIPVVAVAAPGAAQRWTNACLGALIGVIEAIIQLGQFQQTWLLHRATREAMKREDFLHEAKAGPYLNAADPDALYVERTDGIMSGENSKWLSSQQQPGAR